MTRPSREPGTRATVRRCARRLHFVSQLASTAAELGRTTHGAKYLVGVLDELQGDLGRLRAHVATATPDDL